MATFPHTKHSLLVAALALSGCAKLEKEKTVQIIVSGSSSLEVGATLTLEAETINAGDNSYSWESSDPSIATVSDGEVFGRVPGEVTITVTGGDTAATGTLPIVVIPAAASLPHYEEWLGSAHADVTATAFNYWNADGEIPTSCARCHSTPGYMDYIGADDSTAFLVDQAAEIGTVITCEACHNDEAAELDQVTFPSDVTIDELGPEARCMTCHQGRSSKDDVDQAIVDAGSPADDTADPDLHFQNIHYYAAGATLMAGRVRGGYQYDDKVYDWRFRHVPDRNTCIGCHNQHSLELRLDACAECHTDVEERDDVKDIRMIASRGSDYDGDGDTNEGIYYEIEGLREMLYEAIQLYPPLHLLSEICYDGATYPYFFYDTSGDGSCSTDEAAFSNQYASWTPRLIKAAYNYQVSLKDPGAFAHNGKYVIELLYDSIEDLDTAVTVGGLDRTDPGHFNGASTAARRWDADEEISASCSRCHGASEGFRFYVEYGVGRAVEEQANGLDCYTCHENFGTTFDTLELDSATYPGDVTITRTGEISNLCRNCHSGRESGVTIDARIDSGGSARFLNVHYLPASGVFEGSDSNLGYEYSGQTYAAASSGHVGGDECIDCHSPQMTNHTFMIEDAFDATGGCGSTCHVASSSYEEIRLAHLDDTDGDGDATENLADEIGTLSEDLLAAMQDVAAICYNESRYPYFFKDNVTVNGVCDTTETTSFAPWTYALMKSAHNFQISHKDPGAWAHNYDYMAQLLIDSIEDLGGDVSGYTRP